MSLITRTGLTPSVCTGSAPKPVTGNPKALCTLTLSLLEWPDLALLNPLQSQGPPNVLRILKQFKHSPTWGFFTCCHLCLESPPPSYLLASSLRFLLNHDFRETSQMSEYKMALPSLAHHSLPSPPTSLFLAALITAWHIMYHILLIARCIFVFRF